VVSINTTRQSPRPIFTMESSDSATISEGSGLLTPSPSETAFNKPMDAIDHPLSSQDAGESRSDSNKNSKASADSTVSEIPKPIIYRVEYKDIDGKLIKSENLSSPFNSELDNPHSALVLELTTILVSKSFSEQNNEATTSTDKANLTETDKSKATGSGKSAERLRVPSDMRLESHVLKIHSPYIMNALRSVVKYRRGQSFFESTFTIDHPFTTLVHYLDDFRAYGLEPHPSHSDEYQKHSNEHMSVFIDFFDTSPYLKQVREELERPKGSQPTCAFNHIWVHFAPGEFCYIREQGRVSGPFVILYYDQPTEHQGVDAPATDFNVTMWNVQFNGTVFGRVTKTVNIKKFKDERLISSLPVIPAKFYKEASEPGSRFSKASLIARGKAYWNLAKEPAYKEYYGKTLNKPYNEVNTLIQISSWCEHCK
jgi:hypothetical protein